MKSIVSAVAGSQASGWAPAVRQVWVATLDEIYKTQGVGRNA